MCHLALASILLCTSLELKLLILDLSMEARVHRQRSLRSSISIKDTVGGILSEVDQAWD